MTSEVQLDDLSNLPHQDGQTVLDIHRNDVRAKVWYARDRYWVYKMSAGYSSLVAECMTVEQARDAATDVLGEEL
ncbi:MAG TPA: hypothetical protein VGG64_19210 [Pirellulales bacterium]|jgi:hypothetical protein